MFTTTRLDTVIKLLTEEKKNEIPSTPKVRGGSTDEKVISNAKKHLYTSLVQQHKHILDDILDFSEKPKIMILDNDLIGPIGRMMPSSEFKEKGVKVFYALHDVSFKYKNHHFIYLVRSSLKKLNALNALFVKNFAGSLDEKDENLHTVYTLPRFSISLDERLRMNGLGDKIASLTKYALNIFPMGDDLFSLESKMELKTMVNDSNPTPLLNMADALSEVERNYGKIENVNTIGKHSERVFELLKRRRQETDPNPPGTIFARLTLIDRAEDLITPNVIPSTYEALIDEFIGIENNIITLEDKSSLLLDPDNDFYLKLKDAHISNVQKIIKEELEKIKQSEDTATHLLRQPQLSTADLQRATQIAGQLSIRKKSCENHIKIAQYVINKLNKPDVQRVLKEVQNILTESNPKGTLEFIDDMLNRGESLHKVLRILFLYIQVYGNLESEAYENIYTGIIQTFGYQHLFTLKNHEEWAKLRKTPFSKIYEQFHLIEDFDPANPNKIAYTYNGYSPLSGRIIEQSLSKPLEKPAQGLELVCFVGGCTRAEVSACRLISNKIVVLTSELINGNTWVESLISFPKKVK